MTTDKITGKKIGVLVSGGGTNLQSLIDNIHQGTCNAEIACVISNIPDVYALQRASQANIPGQVIRHQAYPDRRQFELELLNTLHQYHVDIVCLAGFMRVLESTFIDAFAGQILNIHPSLLPKFTGLHTHQRAIDAHEKTHGCSVHFATRELDGGPVILQSKVPVIEHDTADSLARRVLEKEHVIYPLCVQWLCENKIHYSNGLAYYENKPLQTPLLLEEL